MFTLAVVILVITGGVVLADRFSFFKGHQVRQGILFGLLAIIANTFSADVYDMGISVGLIDAPPMIAGLMFGPTAGIIAGLIAALERALTPLWGVGETTWLVCSCATLFVSCYAAAFHNFVFDNKRPELIPAIVTVAFGEVMHLAFFFVNQLDNLSLTFEVIYASAEPMIIGSSTAMLLACLACWRRNPQKELNFLQTPVPSFLVFAVAFLVLARFALVTAEKRVDEELIIATEHFDEHMSRTIELFMYRCAHHVLNGIDDPRNCSVEYLKRGAREHGLDEVNIITPDEKIIASSRDDLVNTPFPRDRMPSAEFYKLLDGTENVVSQGFRHGINVTTEYSRYLGLPFPNRDAIFEVAYSFQRLGRELDHIFLPSIADVPVYHTGYFLVVDRDGIIINDVLNHHKVKGKKFTDMGVPASILKSPEKKMIYVRLFGDMSRCMLDRRLGDKSVIAVLPLKDVYWPMLRLIFLCGGALLLLSLLFRWTLVKAARNQRMLDDLREKHEMRKKKEMDLARSVQFSELKVHPPKSDRYAINAWLRPAREVGGDSYDYFEQPDGKVVLAIADVSGKGMSAAIFMMKVRATLRLLGVQGKSVLEFMETTNDILCTNNDAMMFVTCWAGAYDPATGELEFVCAGHNPPFLVKADGTAEMIDCCKAPPLGVRPGYSYHAQKLHLGCGDQIFTYTDGVTEAMNNKQQLYGVKQLQELLGKYGKDGNANLIEQVRGSVDNFVGGAEQSDDITMLSLKVK